MNRYDLKRRPKLFLPTCKIKLSKAGMDHVRRMCKIYGGLTPKWYRNRIGTIATVTDDKKYLVIWESDELPEWRSSAQIWDTSDHFIHYRPRKKSE